MATYTWKGGAGSTTATRTDWTNPSNWTSTDGGAQYPGYAAGDTAVIGYQTSVPTLSTSITLAALTMVSGPSDSNKAILTIKGALIVNSPLTLGTNTILNLSGTGVKFTDTAGVTLAGGAITSSTGASISADTAVTGYGSVVLKVHDAGAYTASGGILTIDRDVDLTGTVATTFRIDDQSTLQFAASVGVSVKPTVTFLGGDNGVLNFVQGNAPATQIYFGTISGFSGTDQIIFYGYDAILGGDQLHTDPIHHTATITNSAGVDEITFTFSASTSLSDFSLSYGPVGSPWEGQEWITYCFMPGTRVATPAGEVAVETLKPGDLVLTSAGEAKPVNWVGRQSVARRFSDPLRNWPVRVKAGALADNVPRRDLLLSPDHALFLDGAMFQAGALVNGTSVVRETDVPDTWTYYHIELDDHSLILAEGAPAETFVDNIDRLAFDNWDEFEALYPDGKALVELPYPRAKAWRQTPRHIRALLAERAEAIGAETAAAA